jgi:hypothetical protein
MSWRAALNPLAGLMRPAGRVFEVPDLKRHFNFQAKAIIIQSDIPIFRRKRTSSPIGMSDLEPLEKQEFGFLL